MTPLHEAGFGDVTQSRVMIHSDKASTQDNKTRDALEKAQWHLSNQVFKCDNDAAKYQLGYYSY